jgi:hypothetical protein
MSTAKSPGANAGARIPDDVFGLDIVVADLCRCGRSILRVDRYSKTSEIKIWRCCWCRKRRGRPTEHELKLMRVWIKKYGWTLEQLCLPDTGGVRLAHQIPGNNGALVAGLDDTGTDAKDRGPVKAAL